MEQKIAIVGGGTVGTAISKQAKARGIETVTIKDVTPAQKQVLPPGTTGVILTAQSSRTEYDLENDDLGFVNTELPHRVVLECIKRGIKNAAFFSTGTVYTSKSELAAKESDVIDVSLLPEYAVSKMAMETLVLGRKTSFSSLKIYRPFMMYGPGLPALRLLSRLPVMINGGQQITLANGKGLVSNPIHVDDAAAFVLDQLFIEGCDVFNLCGDEVMSLRDIALIFGQELGKDPIFKYVDGKENIAIGDTAKADQAGLKHTVALKNGLRDLIDQAMAYSKAEQQRTVHIALPSTGEEEWQAAREPIMSGWLTQGPKVAAFEKQFAAMHQVPHALATTSCTTALHLALEALGVGPGDEVIVPAFTWVATANVVVYCGATPVFADVDRVTFNLDVADALAKVTAKTKAVIPVHLFGLCADIDPLREGLPDHVAILEDAACAAGALYKGRPAGGLGDFAAFSFHPRKSITTGEGGMLTACNPELAQQAEKMRNHGAEISEEQRHAGPRPYLLPDFNLLGFNYRMTDLQGAVGLVQLAKLDGFIDERAHRAAWYGEQLKDIEWLACPQEPEGGRHAWQAFVTCVDPQKAPTARNQIMDKLQKFGVATRPGTHAVHMLGYYAKRYGIKPDDFPGARDCDANTMAIPLHNRMTDEDYEYVVKSIKSLG